MRLPSWVRPDYALALAGFGLTLAVATQARAALRPSYIPRQGGGFAEIQRLGALVEDYAGIPGFTAYALGKAERESDGNNLISNTSQSEAAAACRGYDRNDDGMFADNPFPRARWCFGSGGYYGQLPSTALSADGFHNADPWLVFDPEASTAMEAALVRRIVRNHFPSLPPQARNWLTVRAFSASNKVGLDWQETLQRRRDVRLRFAEDLQRRGIDPDFMYQPVEVKHWPGAVSLLHFLQGGGRAVA